MRKIANWLLKRILVKKPLLAQPAVMCSFTHKELSIISEALTHLHHAKVEYLDWKKDEYSQRVLPVQIKEVVEMIWKVDKLEK